MKKSKVNQNQFENGLFSIMNVIESSYFGSSIQGSIHIHEYGIKSFVEFFTTKNEVYSNDLLGDYITTLYFNEGDTQKLISDTGGVRYMVYFPQKPEILSFI